MRAASTLFFFVSLAVSCFATVEKIEADISAINTELNALDASISAFPNTGGSLTQALAIRSNAVTLKDTIDDSTTDVTATPSPVSEDDGRSILTSAEDISGTIDHALQGLVAKKAAFQSLRIGGAIAILKKDLDNLSTSTTAYENALIALTPPDLVDEATTLRNKIDASFSAAIAAFA